MKTTLSILLAATALAVSQPVFAFGTPESFAELAAKNSPAVVNIYTSKEAKVKKDKGGDLGKGENPLRQFNFPPGSPFEQFNELLERYGQGLDEGQGDGKMQSLGSGFIIDESGYIVTNNHVIDGADEIKVMIGEKEDYVAKLIGRDAKTDLALLKIEAKKPLPFVSFGDSDKARVGDWVMVVGNPFGLGGTVTAGIISAKTRDINAGPFDEFIQTDAAINRGNSGGPMFNLAGEVVGINTAIYSPNGVGNVGIGFALPANQAAPIIKQLREKGTIARAWLGVKIQDVTTEIAESLGMPEEKGALVAEVMLKSPAAKAGVKVGDLITEFDGKQIDKMRSLPRLVAETPIGKKVEIKVLRAGKEIALSATVEKMDESVDDLENTQKETDKITAEKTVQGMVLKPLDDDARQQLGIEKTDGITGLVILDTEPKSPARDKGLIRGDVLIEANRTKLKTVGDLQNVVREAKEKGRNSLLLLVWREGETLFMALPVEKKK